MYFFWFFFFHLDNLRIQILKFNGERIRFLRQEVNVKIIFLTKMFLRGGPEGRSEGAPSRSGGAHGHQGAQIFGPPLDNWYNPPLKKILRKWEKYLRLCCTILQGREYIKYTFCIA